jgi:uncharacterized RDD family membrane protein YckC
MDQQTLLDNDFNDEPVEYEYATQGQRFGNYIIDRIVVFILAAVAGGVLGAFSPEIAEDDAALNIAGIFISFAVSFFYYTIMEGAMNGKTIGKFITRTRALRHDGAALDMGKAASRSLCRFIPFEPFSFLGEGASGWHDTISGTIVVKD